MNRSLLLHAYEVIDGIPDDRFKLHIICDNRKEKSQRTNPRHCGTIGCAIGFLGMHPDFVRKGLGYRTDEFGEIELAFKGDDVSYGNAGAKVFNINYDDAEKLFRPAMDWERAELATNNDKDIWKWRCRKLLRDQSLIHHYRNNDVY